MTRCSPPVPLSHVMTSCPVPPSPPLRSSSQLHTLIAGTPVVELDVDELKRDHTAPLKPLDSWDLVPSTVLYERSSPSDFCTLILLGRVIILAGKDRFRADAGAWKVLGTDALLSDNYEPDFSAFASPEKRSNEVRSRDGARALGGTGGP